jgi:hypothetical protein
MPLFCCSDEWGMWFALLKIDIEKEDLALKMNYQKYLNNLESKKYAKCWNPHHKFSM